MEKEFVPYELAVKLKALGFDEKCLAYYKDNELYQEAGVCYVNSDFEPTMVWDEMLPNKNCTAPLYQQAFRWFRDKNIYATINTYHSVNEDKPFGLSIDYLHESGKWDYFDYRGESDFETYEEAELACLDKLIEIVESKSE